MRVCYVALRKSMVDKQDQLVKFREYFLEALEIRTNALKGEHTAPFRDKLQSLMKSMTDLTFHGKSRLTRKERHVMRQTIRETFFNLLDFYQVIASH